MTYSEIVKYHNEMNKSQLGKFNSVELNLFFAICSQLKDKKTNTVVFDFQKLRDLSKFKMTSDKAFIKNVDSMYSKLLTLTFLREYETGVFTRFTLFDKFVIDTNNKTVSISVRIEYAHMLNFLHSEFTSFELKEFTLINSSYAKNMYRLLKQWKTVGKRVFDIDEFYSLLDIPAYYKQGNIDQKVLAPIMDELPAYFDNLKIDKVKKGQGSKVRSIVVTFTPQKDFKKTVQDTPTITMHDWTKGG